MLTYTINIAKAYTQSDWRKLPAHGHFARVVLTDTTSAEVAMAELERLQTLYPWPEYHLTLQAERTITQRETLGSTAPMGFLEAHQWDYPSIHEGES